MVTSVFVLFYILSGNANSNAKVINKNVSKIYKFCVLQIACFSLKFVGIFFVSSSYDSIILSHVITESSIIFATYLPFLQLRVAGFQI